MVMAVALDAGAAAVGGGIAFAIRFGQFSPGYAALTGLLPLLWVVTVAANRGYETRFVGTGAEEFRRILHSGLLLMAGIAVLSYSTRAEVARGYVALAVPATVVAGLGGRYLLRRQLHRRRTAGRCMQKVVVVGRADATVALMAQLSRERLHGMQVVAACVPSGDLKVDALAGVPVLGGYADVLEAVEVSGAEVVAVASSPDLAGDALRRLAWSLDERGVDLVVAPGIVEVAGPRLSIRPVAGLPLLHLERPTTRGGKLVLKSAFDRLLAAVVLLLIMPVLVVVAAAVRLSGPGPVLFRQSRVGVGGRAFTMLKFRTMVAHAEELKIELAPHSDGHGLLFKMRRDPRVTRVGKVLRRYSLDELPQLVNVLTGNMSLVGPRPPLPEEVSAYTQDAFRRLRVRPGLTGLWQISGRSDLSWEESLRLDLRYVDNWSMSMDLLILWKTGRAVLRGSGAY